MLVLCLFNQTSCSGQSKFTNHVSKSKDPPRYEDAVKQTRSILPAAQVRIKCLSVLFKVSSVKQKQTFCFCSGSHCSESADG